MLAGTLADRCAGKWLASADAIAGVFAGALLDVLVGVHKVRNNRVADRGKRSIDTGWKEVSRHE